MVTRRDMLAAALIGAASSPATASPVAHPFYSPGRADRDKMMAWTAEFRRKYNAGRLEARDLFTPSFTLVLFNKPLMHEKQILSALAEYRSTYGELLTPVNAESVAFRPEGAILFYLTALQNHDSDYLGIGNTMVGSHDCISMRIRFDIDQPANRVGNGSRVLEINAA
jgi:hypothetical protein